MYNLRTDAYHSQDTIGELQYLIDLSTNNKEELDYSILYVQNRIVNLNHILKGVRDELLDFLEKHQLTPESFPVISRVLCDDVMPDTAPEQNIGAVDVEKAMKKNIPNETFDLLKIRITVHVTVELNQRIDYVRKLKLNLAKYCADLAKLYKAKSDYAEKEDSFGEPYKEIRTDLENFIALHKSIGEFKYLFTNTPGTYTMDHSVKLQDSKTGQYGVYYIGKKKSIKNQADKILENFQDIARYEQVPTPVVFIAIKKGESTIPENLLKISKYFSEQGDTPSDSILPTHYVDAYDIKSGIIGKVNAIMLNVSVMISVTKDALDAIRGTTGLGNRDLEGIYNLAIEISKSPANSRKIEQQEFKDITETNRTFLVQAQKKAEYFKGYLQRGVKALDQVFLKTQRDLLVRMSFLGYPKDSIKGRTETLENHVREKVRAKFGFIPFEDEQVVMNQDGSFCFVKRSELDPATVSKDNFKPGIRKSDAEAASLAKAALK
jgi:hypothetical protein